MTQTVTDESGVTHNFPDAATPEMISQALGIHGFAPPAPAPAYEAAAANVAQGATMGWGDEIGHGIANAGGFQGTIPEGIRQAGYLAGRGVNAAENLFGEGNPNPPSYPEYAQNLDNNKNTVMAPLQAYNAEHPVIGGAEQAAGGVASMMGLSKLAGAAVPKVANALKAFAEAHPYLAASGVGGSGGAVYGAGTGDETTQGRGGNALAQGLVGSAVGPLVSLGVNKIAAPAVNAAGRAVKGALTEFRDFMMGGGQQAAPAVATPAAAPAATAPISTITNRPLGAPPVPNAAGPVSMTGKLGLSPGVKAKDPNLLRIEENARQGLLGNEAQGQMNASDAGVVQDARNAMQQLKGVTNKDGDELLTSSVKTFQDAANKTKSHAQALYKQRDEMLANTVVDRGKMNRSLGVELQNVIKAPENLATFRTKAAAPAKELYMDLMDSLTSKSKEMPMVDLTAWRQDVAALAVEKQGTPAGVAAGRLGRAYDDWMDNSFKQHMVISGDANVAQKAAEASSAWKNYKSLFGSENSPVIGGMTKPYDATPRDFVDKVFGANISGNGSTALNMRKMVAALPQDAQQQFKDNVFSGLVSRVFEGANSADTLKIAALRNNLLKLRDSQVYQEHFAGDKAKSTVVNNLIDDLNQHITQTGRADVRSPSGGHTVRLLKDLVGGVAQIPVVGKMTGAKIADTALNKAGDMAQASTDRAAFRQAMRDAYKQAQANGKKGKVFDLDALKSGIIAAQISNSTTDKGVKK
jgi:hypothetical protein